MAPVEEDEIGQWLQYPLDDDDGSGGGVLDKGFYCSDFFGSSTWLPPPPPSPSPSPTPFLLPAGQMGGALGDRLVAAAPAVMSSAVDAALAMGAERASGVVVPSGLEAFSKVRTSLQQGQGQGKPLGLCYKGGKKLAEVAALPAFGPYSISASSCYHSSLTSVPVARAATPNPTPASRPLMVTPRTDIGTAKMLTSRSKMDTAETTTPMTEIGTFRAEKGTSRAEKVAFRAETSTPRTEMGAFRAEMGTLRTEMGTAEMDTSRTEMGAADMDSSRIEMGTPRTERAADKVGITRTEIGASISKVPRTSPTSGPDTALIRPLTCSKKSLKEVDGQMEDVEGESTSFKHHHRHHHHHPLPRISLKRSRSTEIHNLSERRRRDRINEKMRALQELIPNSNKTDKASVLDEAIDYLKMLQAQLQMMTMRSGMYVPPMMFNPAMQVPPPMAPLNPLHHHPGMGMVGPGTGMGIGIIGRPDFPPPPPPPPLSSSSSSSSSSSTSSSSSSPSSSSSCCLAQTSNCTPGLSSCGTMPSSADSFVASGTPYYAPLAFPYPQYQVSPQAFQPINMDAYNAFLLHQQYLQHHHQHHHHNQHHQPEQPHQQQQQQPQNGSPPNG